MGRDRRRRPVVGWLLGALLAFCAVWPGTSGLLVRSMSDSSATTLVRPGSAQHIDAVTAAQRPDVHAAATQLISDAPAQRANSVTLAAGSPDPARAVASDSAFLAPTAARGPPPFRPA